MRSIGLTVVALALAAGAFWMFGRGAHEVPTGTELERTDVSAPVAPIGAAPREVAATSSRPTEPETPKLTIRGVVVDSDGRAAPGVRIVAEVQPAPQQPTHGWPPESYGAAVSAEDGTFEVVANPKGLTATRFRLAARQNPGYGDVELADQAWGTANARLVLPLGSTLEVTIVDEESGQPVDTLTVGIGWPSDPRLFPGREAPAIVARPRPGVVVFGQVRASKALLFVVPKDSLHARISHEVALAGVGRQRVTVPVPRERHRGLRVLGADGAPVAKAMFQLVRDYAPESKSPHIGDFEDVKWGGMPRLRVQGGFVDERGESVLYGAPGIRYDLVVEAPGLASQVFHDVFVSDGMTPFVAVLASGAAIVGKLGPPEVVEGMWRTDAEISGGKVFRPALWLEPKDSKRTGIEVAQRAQIPLRRDGTFELEGLAAGSYRVNLYWFDGSAKPHSEVLGEVVDLGGRERRQVEFSLGRIVAREVSIEVQLDGVPFTEGQVRLDGTAHNALGSLVALEGRSATTDREGRLVAMLQPGAWRAMLTVRSGDKPSIQVLSLDTADVGVDTREVRFEARRIRVMLRLLDAKGQPVPDTLLQAGFPGFGWNKTTDAGGGVVIEGASLGRLSVTRKVPIKDGQWAWSEVGAVEIARSPATQSFELRLPR